MNQNCVLMPILSSFYQTLYRILFSMQTELDSQISEKNHLLPCCLLLNIYPPQHFACIIHLLKEVLCIFMQDPPILLSREDTSSASGMKEESSSKLIFVIVFQILSVAAGVSTISGMEREAGFQRAQR